MQLLVRYLHLGIGIPLPRAPLDEPPRWNFCSLPRAGLCNGQVGTWLSRPRWSGSSKRSWSSKRLVWSLSRDHWRLVISLWCVRKIFLYCVSFFFQLHQSLFKNCVGHRISNVFVQINGVSLLSEGFLKVNRVWKRGVYMWETWRHCRSRTGRISTIRSTSSNKRKFAGSLFEFAAFCTSNNTPRRWRLHGSHTICQSSRTL